MQVTFESEDERTNLSLEHLTSSPRASTHQSWFVGCLHFLPLDLVPVDVLEEGVHRDLAVGAKGDTEAPRGVLVEKLPGEGESRVFLRTFTKAEGREGAVRNTIKETPARD